MTVKAANNAFTGLSGYPTSTTQVQNIINTMNANGLNIYRMSFNPTWSSGPHPYHQEYVQYFLDHSSYTIIVDRNHLYPPQESSASAARNNWNTVRNSIFQVLQAWPNNQRVAVELINEYVSSDFYSLMQSLVDEIRGAGYTNPIVVDKWNQPWTVINDPLDNTFQGYHFYFNSWSVSGAVSQMNIALSRGIKIINTEVGADYNEYNSFTTETVNELNDFMTQCASLGVGNTVWMNENLNNLPRYQSLGIDFPATSTPPTTNPTPSPSPTPQPNPTPTPSPTLPPSSGTVFQDGFESNSLNAWSDRTTTSGGSVTTTNYTPYQGNYHARFYTRGSSQAREDAYVTKDVDLKTATATGYFYISGSSNGAILDDNMARLYLIRFSNNGGYIAWAGIRRDDGVDKWLLYTNGAYMSAAVPIEANQYYRVSLHWDASSRTAELYVSGVKILEASTSSFSAVTQVDMGVIYTYNVQGSLTVYGDSFTITDN